MFRNFKRLINCDELLLLESSQLNAILKSDNLNIDTEEDVFDALMKWIRFDINSRKDSFIMHIENIRLQHVNKSVGFNFKSIRNYDGVFSNWLVVPFRDRSRCLRRIEALRGISQ